MNFPFVPNGKFIIFQCPKLWAQYRLIVMCLNNRTPQNHHFPFGTNGKVVVLGVPILKHFRLYLLSGVLLQDHDYSIPVSSQYTEGTDFAITGRKSDKNGIAKKQITRRKSSKSKITKKVSSILFHNLSRSLRHHWSLPTSSRIVLSSAAITDLAKSIPDHF